MGIFSHLPELAAVLVVALLVFGPKRLPEIGNALGQTIRNFQHSMKEVTESHDAQSTTAALPPAAATAALPPASVTLATPAGEEIVETSTNQ
jgi:sec-independent protein translocase protein TatA